MGAASSLLPAAEVAGKELGSNMVVMAVTQLATAGLGIYCQFRDGYASEVANCSHVAYVQQQIDQLRDLENQVNQDTQSLLSLRTKLQQIKASTRIYAQSLSNMRQAFRTRATITVLLNIYITTVIIFWIISKSQNRASLLRRGRLDDELLRSAQKASEMASTLQAQAAGPGTL